MTGSDMVGAYGEEPSRLAALWSAVCSPSWALQHSHQPITASLLLPGLVSNYALFLVVITVYPLRS